MKNIDIIREEFNQQILIDKLKGFNEIGFQKYRIKEIVINEGYRLLKNDKLCKKGRDRYDYLISILIRDK